MRTGDHVLKIDTVDTTAGIFAHCSCGSWRIKAARNRAEVRIHHGSHVDAVEDLARVFRDAEVANAS